MKNKVLIYTCIYNNYDNLPNYEVYYDNIDYICLSDREIPSTGKWQVRLINDLMIEEYQNASSLKKSRYVKFFPHKLFPEYDFSLYIDANIIVKSDDLLDRITECIGKGVKYATVLHPQRDCLYDESLSCIICNRGKLHKIFLQILIFCLCGFPVNYGLFENNIIFRSHKSPDVNQIMNDWWWWVKHFSYRDQLSLMYVLWRNKYTPEPLYPSVEEGPRFLYKDYKFKEHKSLVEDEAASTPLGRAKTIIRTKFGVLLKLLFDKLLK